MVKLLPPAHPPRAVPSRSLRAPVPPPVVQAKAAGRLAVPPPPTKFGPAPVRAAIQPKRAPAPPAAVRVIQRMEERPKPAGPSKPTDPSGPAFWPLRFPFWVRHMRNPAIGRLAVARGPRAIAIMQGDDRVASLVFDDRTKVWGMKNIWVDDVLRGQNVGTLLVYLFAQLAIDAGATGLDVHTPSGLGLYEQTGWKVERDPAGGIKHRVDGDPVKVRDAAKAMVSQFWLISSGVELPILVPGERGELQGFDPVKRKKRKVKYVTSGGDAGNPAIGDRDL